MVKTEQGNFVMAMMFAKAAEVPMRAVARGAPLVNSSLDESSASLVRSSSIVAIANKDRPAGKITDIAQSGRKIQLSVNTRNGASLCNFIFQIILTHNLFHAWMIRNWLAPLMKNAWPQSLHAVSFFMSTNAGCSLMILAWFWWRCLQTQSSTLLLKNNRTSRDRLGPI